MPDVLIATRNKHKVSEISAILGSRYNCVTLDPFPDAPAVVEDANTFSGNALKKSVSLANWIAATDRRIDYVLADDSGLEVDALNGAPGVHSARFAALDSGNPGNSPDPENNAKLLRLLKDIPVEKRTARFRCAIAWTPIPESLPESASKVCEAEEAELGSNIFEGTCEGTILFAPRGGQGFGYDPLFVPRGHTETFAELGEEEKNSLSHRGKALEKLKSFLLGGAA